MVYWYQVSFLSWKSSPSAGNEDNVENKESQLASDSPNGMKDECSENEKVMYLNSSLVFCSIYGRIPFSKYCPYGIKPHSINQSMLSIYFVDVWYKSGKMGHIKLYKSLQIVLHNISRNFCAWINIAS